MFWIEEPGPRDAFAGRAVATLERAALFFFSPLFSATCFLPLTLPPPRSFPPPLPTVLWIRPHGPARHAAGRQAGRGGPGGRRTSDRGRGVVSVVVFCGGRGRPRQKPPAAPRAGRDDRHPVLGQAVKQGCLEPAASTRGGGRRARRTGRVGGARGRNLRPLPNPAGALTLPLRAVAPSAFRRPSLAPPRTPRRARARPPFVVPPSSCCTTPLPPCHQPLPHPSRARARLLS